MQNRLSAVAAALLTAVLLAGCSSQTPEQELKEAAPAEWKAYEAASQTYEKAQETLKEAWKARKAAEETAWAAAAPVEWNAWKAAEQELKEAAPEEWKAWKATVEKKEALGLAEWEARKSSRKAYVAALGGSAARRWSEQIHSKTKYLRTRYLSLNANMKVERAAWDARKTYGAAWVEPQEAAWKAARLRAEWNAHEKALMASEAEYLMINATIWERAWKISEESAAARDALLPQAAPAEWSAYKKAELEAWNARVDANRKADKAVPERRACEEAQKAAWWALEAEEEEILKALAPVEWKAYEEAWETEREPIFRASQEEYWRVQAARQRAAHETLIAAREAAHEAWEKAQKEPGAALGAEWEMRKTAREEAQETLKAAREAWQKALKAAAPAEWIAQEALEKAAQKTLKAKRAYEAAQEALQKAATAEWNAYEAAQARQN